MGDDEWLLGAHNYFAGYRFEEGLEVPRFAGVVRVLMDDVVFVKAVVKSVIFFKGLDERSDSPLIRFRSQHYYYRRFGFKVERLVLSGLRSLQRFATIPRRTPSEHRNHYEGIAKAADDLRQVVASDPDLRHDQTVVDSLASLSDFAREIASDPPLQRPHAVDADVTFVAKEVIASFRSDLHKPFPAAAASLVNAVLADRRPVVVVDATYMQSLARSMPPEYFL